MVQLLVLFFLSIRQTHGYEIQRFIQVNHMDEWNTIKSGSIYYAMNKLEKLAYIRLYEKVGLNEKSKRMYEITDLGLEALRDLALKELAKPLVGVMSEKFLLYPILLNLSKAELQMGLKKHMADLQGQVDNIKAWQDKKTSTHTMEQATFKAMLGGLEVQLNWHQVLYDHLDEAISESKKVRDYIINNRFAD